MHVTTRTNMPILTSNFIFPNREGLERLRKFFQPFPSAHNESGIENFKNHEEEERKGQMLT